MDVTDISSARQYLVQWMQERFPKSDSEGGHND